MLFVYLYILQFTGTYGSFGACLRVNPWDLRVCFFSKKSMRKRRND